jgi:acyl transferase domain-containing protein/NAD(P)-dependent dehydrogenase (short-subunit alcohol dehydrogenase family)
LTNTTKKHASKTNVPVAVPLAIVGIGCLFPKANNPEEYWKNIREGVDAITEVPKSHWKPEDYYNKDKNATDMTYAHRGGFINQVDFDPLLYGLSPNNIEATDTTQLLGMVVARQALLDAGYSTTSDNTDGRSFNRNRTSVILGVTGTLELVIPLGARLGHPHWRKALAEAGVTKDVAEDVVQRISDSYVPWQENSFPGLLGNVAAGRIANRFDLGGTNCVVDAACASSLSAIHMAALELYSGRSDMAISGGFDTFNDIFMYMCFSKTPALSPTGNSRPFDINGDGTILGEGLGAVILKRLDDAERDGDKIYAILKGMGSSSDGRGNAIYAPSANGQTRALKNAYEDAGVTPTSIELVEAHGTGTRVGDAVEAEALSSVYREDKENGTWCALGSVKSMIGHTKAAAGVAGLIKVAMALKHKVLPPTIKIDRPLELLNPGNAPVYVNTHKRPWVGSPNHPRRAAISAFGFGGSNFHCVLEEAEQTKPEIEWDGEVLIFGISDKSLKALKGKLKDINTTLAWDELRYLAASSLQSFKYNDIYRLVLVITPTSDLNELIIKINSRFEEKDNKTWTLTEGAFFGSGKQKGKLAMLFPGQGSQYPDMLIDLACSFPQMQSALSEANTSFAQSKPEQQLSDLIYPLPVFTDEHRLENTEQLRLTDNAQPAIGAVSIGTYQILNYFGIKPNLTAGHSFGELTALCAAGCIDSKGLFELAIKRGELMQANKEDDNGSMLAVSVSAAVLHEILEAEQLDLIIANHNAPKQVVLSGASDQIDRAVKVLGKRGIGAKKLPVSAAFHSSFVADAEKPFNNFLDTIKFKAGKIPVFSNSTSEVYPENIVNARALLASQLARPVEFVTEIENMYIDGAVTFIEVGPGKVLTGLVSAILGEREFTAIAVDASRGRKSGQFDLACALAQIAATGHKFSIKHWDKGYIERYKQIPENKPGMTIKLSGANYVKPRPKHEPIRNSQQVNSITSTSISDDTTTKSLSEMSNQKNLYKEPIADSNDLLKSAQQAIFTLQKMEQQTTELHRQYLEGQEIAQKNIQKLIEQNMQMLTGDFVPASISNFAPLERPTQNISSATNQTISKSETHQDTPELERLLLEVVSDKTGYPIDMLSMEMSLDTDLGIDSIKRVEILSALHEKLPGAANIQPEDLGTFRLLKHIAEFLVTNTKKSTIESDLTTIKNDISTVINNEFSTTLFEVLSDKTGYPVDMLKPDMNLDSDLGIDSIKRVEILSAFQERMPEAPSINPEDLTTLQTLQQIIDFMQANSNAQVPVPVQKPAVTQGNSDSELIQALLEVVADKTGYPMDMLQLEMNLDTDLGIDSIKRVEILSAFQEKRPDTVAINPENLASLQTLQQIVDHMQDDQNSSGTSIPTKTPLKPISSNSRVKVNFTEALLDVVADKTGYPVDMLNLEMNLDTDLGIDSIKRVEILSAFQEKMPDAPSINPDDLATLQTLQQIVNFMHQEDPSPVITSNDKSTPVTQNINNEIWRGVVNLQKISDGRQQISSQTHSLIGITDDGTDISDDICNALEQQGLTTCKLSITNRKQSELTGLVIIVPAKLSDNYITNVLELIQYHAASLKGKDPLHPGLLACVTGMGGSFGIDSLTEVNLNCAAISGIIKTADKEWGNVTCRSIDVDFSTVENDKLGVTIANELMFTGPLETGLINHQCYEIELPSLPVSANAIEIEQQLRPGETVVISGGARGITAEIAIELARHYKVNLLLLGRSALPEKEPGWLINLNDEKSIKQALVDNNNESLNPKSIESKYQQLLANREIIDTLLRIEKEGVIVKYQSVDIRDKAEVDKYVDEARKEMGLVTGIVHGAGVISDKFIIDKSTEQFNNVFSTKVDGLNALLAATEDDNLKILVMFSSSTGRFGRKGQCDYAAANEVLNKIAQHQSRLRPDCRVLSMNWGPWDGGMVTPQLRKLFEKEGVGVIPLKAGSRHLVKELNASGSVEIVILGSEPVIQNNAKESTTYNQNIPTPNNNMHVAFERMINIKDFPVLNSHVMNGKAVLPAALILEWFTNGAMHNNPGLVFKGIKDLRIFKGVILDSDSQINIQILAGDTLDQEGELQVPVELRHGKVLHAGGRIILGNKYDTVIQTRINDLSGQYSQTIEEAYTNGRLFHGEALQGITRVNSCSAKGISGNVNSAPQPSQWIHQPIRTGWLTDPLVMDAAFQLMILWSFENMGVGSLPTRVNHYRQFQSSFPKDETIINIQIESSNKHEILATIEFLDNKDQLVARIDGYECVVDASLNEAFRKNQLAETTE